MCFINLSTHFLFDRFSRHPSSQASARVEVSTQRANLFGFLKCSKRTPQIAQIIRYRTSFAPRNCRDSQSRIVYTLLIDLVRLLSIQVRTLRPYRHDTDQKLRANISSQHFRFGWDKARRRVQIGILLQESSFLGNATRCGRQCTRTRRI